MWQIEIVQICSSLFLWLQYSIVALLGHQTALRPVPWRRYKYMENSRANPYPHKWKNTNTDKYGNEISALSQQSQE